MFEKITLKRFKKFQNTTFDINPNGLSLLAGGNNSGKSTLLQSLAIWDFCLTVLENEKGREALLPSYTGQGVGLSDDEFSPVLIPALNHLWTNLTNQIQGQDGYSLSIRPEWTDSAGDMKFIEIRLALANDRLFLKPKESNLVDTDIIPRVGFVPPFAGIAAREQKMSVAQRRAMVGSGLVGGIIRNLLLDLEEANRESRAKLKLGRNQIKGSDLRILRETDPWEQLQAAIGQYFNTSLTLEPFNELYHTSIRAKLVKGDWDGKKIKKFPKFKPRDLMAEGSGFLQWLSVFALALDPEINVILLDEPDAHLHSSLQTLLVSELERIAKSHSKQILLATHSTEILRWADHSDILKFSGSKAKYLSGEEAKIGLFAGLGSDFSPRLDKLKKSKALLIVENHSDARFLRIFAQKLGKDISNDIVIWPWTGSSKERRQLFYQLKADIPELRAVSIRDRDDLSQNQVDPESLQDKSEKDASGDGLRLCVWQRRHIENYLLCPSAIARAASNTVEQVVEHLRDKHATVIPNNFTSSDVLQSSKDARGKEIIETSDDSIEKTFNISKYDIADSLLPEEICDDVRQLVSHVIDLIES